MTEERRKELRYCEADRSSRWIEEEGKSLPGLESRPGFEEGRPETSSFRTRRKRWRQTLVAKEEACARGEEERRCFGPMREEAGFACFDLEKQKEVEEEAKRACLEHREHSRSRSQRRAGSLGPTKAAASEGREEEQGALRIERTRSRRSKRIEGEDQEEETRLSEHRRGWCPEEEVGLQREGKR